MRPASIGSRLRRLLRMAAPVLVILLLPACLLPPDPVTTAGQDVFNLYIVILVLAGIVFVGVEGFIVYALVRYRRQPGDEVLPPQHHGNNTIELIWTAIPTVIVLILFVLSILTLGTVNARSSDPLTIHVEGFQWQWTFRYEQGVTVEAGTVEDPPVLTVPVGEPVRVVLDSLDVIHAFYVPQFLIKRDVVPVGENGEANELEFTITEEGTYTGQCAEFCGQFHADMVFVIDAVSREEYDAWFTAALAGETPPPPPPGECETIELTAANTAFDLETIEAPANEEFCIALTNEDTIPHDVGINAPDGSEIFNGEDIPGGESVVYVIDPLEPGDYEFICTLHPTEMVGDLSVTD